MHNVAETTANTAVAAASTTNGSQEAADGAAFTRELESRLANFDMDKIAESMNKLASAFPNTGISSQTVGSFASSTTFFLEIEGGTTINISPEVMEQLSTNDEMFDKIKNMIGSLFTASESQTLMPTTSSGSVATRTVVVDMNETRFVEVQRDQNGRALSMASLKLQTQQMAAETMQKLFESIGTGAKGNFSANSGITDLWQLLGANGTGGSPSSSSSRNQGFAGFVSGSVSWEMEGIFMQPSSSRQILESSKKLVGQMDIIIEQWEGSGTKADLFTYMQVMGLSDPLVFDLADEGINLTAAEDGVYFDIKGDGTPARTGWISGNNAFLYRDENGNGVADDANELFGDHGGFANGFDKLAQYDDNGDGVIDENDAIYNDLRLWRDLNGDGVNQAGESMTLAEAGIKSINLNYNKTYEKDRHGNVIGERSSFTRTDGSQGLVADVWLRQQK